MTINLFGVVPAFDPFFRGDLEEIKRLLEALGLEVNTFFTPDQTFENLRHAPQAALNIQFSHVWGAEFVEHFQQRHGTPFWVTDLPVGAEAAERFLRGIAQRLPVSPQRLSQVIDQENERYYNYFIRAADVITNGQFFYYSATVTNANYAIPLASYLSREMGWRMDDIFITDLLDDGQRDRYEQAFQASELSGWLHFEPNTQRIGRLIAQNHPRSRGQRYLDADLPLYLVGSGLERYTAQELGAQLLTVSYPLPNRLIADRGYAGYRGGLRLLEDLISAVITGK